MGDRTIELTITDAYNQDEEDRASREFVYEKIFTHAARKGDAELERYLFIGHDEAGDEYVIAIPNRSSEEVWAMLWTHDHINVTIDRGMVMRTIPHLSPEAL